MRRVAALYAGSTVVIVTHAGVITQVLGALAGESAARWDVFRPDNASLTVVRWAGDGGVVIRFNDRRHLDSLEGRPKRHHHVHCRPSRPVNQTEFGPLYGLDFGFSAELLGPPHAVGTTDDAQVLTQRRDSSDPLARRAAGGIQRYR
jgi:hypothetical protein